MTILSQIMQEIQVFRVHFPSANQVFIEFLRNRAYGSLKA